MEIDATGTSPTEYRIGTSSKYGSVGNPGQFGDRKSGQSNAQTINNWPVADFDFTGNGAGTENPAAFLIDTGSIPLPAGSAAGDPLWVSGYTTPFGSAPPDFNAVAVNSETSVQIAGGQVGGGASTAPGTKGCGIGSQVCDPAVLEVEWSAAATVPFATLSDSGFSLNPSAAGFSGVVRIGPELIDLSTLPQSPLVVPTTLTVTSTFAPRFTVGILLLQR